MQYKIIGDYTMLSQNLLEEFDNLFEAKRWVEQYIRWGDFGGYEFIVIKDSDTGFVITEYESHLLESHQ